jgi:hypothetical protein
MNELTDETKELLSHVPAEVNPPAKKAWKLALEDMRIKYSGEIERTIKTLVEIRDDGEAANKDRTDAGYKLARLLGMGITGESKSVGGHVDPPQPAAAVTPMRLSDEYAARLRELTKDLDDDND